MSKLSAITMRAVPRMARHSGTNAIVTVGDLDRGYDNDLPSSDDQRGLGRNAGTLPVNGSYPNLVELYDD